MSYFQIISLSLLFVSLLILACFQKKEPVLLITSDFNSVRRCSTLDELYGVAQTMISANPDILTLDVCSPDLVNYHSSIGFFIKGSPFDALFEKGIDPYGIMVDTLKQHQITVLANVRMNDHHGRPIQWTPWEREHMEWSLFEDTGARDWKAIGRLRHMDYAIEGVRDYRFSILKEVIDRFNVDGFQLDFGRTAPFVSEPKSENAKYMTEYVKRVRNLLDETSRKQQRERMLLGVLVPWDYDFCVAEGLEIQTWIDQGFIDYVSPGEWYYADWNLPLEPWKKTTADKDCQLYPFTPGNVSPYQDFEHGEPSLLGENRVLDPAKIRAIADNFMSQQPDGFAFYNFYTFDFGEYYPNLREWVNPEISQGLPRHYFNGRKLVYHATEKATFDKGIAFERTPLVTGEPVKFPFRFGTSLDGKKALLKMVFKHAKTSDSLIVRLNGMKLKAAEIEEKEVNWKNEQPIRALFWSAELDASALVSGENWLTAELPNLPEPERKIEAGEFEIWVKAE